MQKEQYTKEQLALFIIINIILLMLITYASTSLTVSFFGSIGSGEIKTSNLIMGLVNDCCKIFLPLVAGIAIYKRKYFHAAILVLIIFGTMYLSYLASQGLDLNNSNQVLLDGTGKQELVTAKVEKTKELTDLETEKKELISPIQSQIDNLPKDFITERKRMTTEIKTITKQYRDKAEKIQGKIDEYDNKIQNYKADSSLTTKGYHALSKYTGIEVGTITKWKNIFMEILAIILSVNLGLLIGESNFNLFTLFRTGYSAWKNRPKRTETIVNEDKMDIPPDESRNKKQPDDACLQGCLADIELKKSEALKYYAGEALKSIKSDNSCDGITKIYKRMPNSLVDKGLSRNDIEAANKVLREVGCIEVRPGGTYVVDLEGLKKYA